MMELPINYDKATKWFRRKARLQYQEIQENKCQYCKEDLDGKPAENIESAFIDLRLFPVGMLNYPIHLHHCHKTGMTIGAVHARCNAYLWQYHGE